MEERRGEERRGEVTRRDERRRGNRRGGKRRREGRFEKRCQRSQYVFVKPGLGFTRLGEYYSRSIALRDTDRLIQTK
jgi:hypothetical protein